MPVGGRQLVNIVARFQANYQLPTANCQLLGFRFWEKAGGMGFLLPRIP
jgi:hypothetical protein